MPTRSRPLPTKAVILARGLGKRMRALGAGAELTADQERIAAAGIKALMPIAGARTMLDLIVENLHSAGFTQICMVIGPEHDAIREYCAANGRDVNFAIQQEPLGTADAVLAARACVGDELFLVVNSDNLYPPDCLRLLRDVGGPALIAFEREALIARSNIPEERIAKFAAVEVDAEGRLVRIVEKPLGGVDMSLISMNAWLFSPAIFEACRSIGPSERGEYELASAVQYAIDILGERFAAIRSSEGVLDLSSRADVESVSRSLKINGPRQSIT